MIWAILFGLLIAIAVVSVIFMYYVAMVMLGIIAIVYIVTFVALNNLLGDDQQVYSIFGTMILGTAILWVLARITGMSEGKQKAIEKNYPDKNLNDLCPCGSGKRFENCHGIEKIQTSTETRALPTYKRRTYICPCGSGKEYSTCHGSSRKKLLG